MSIFSRFSTQRWCEVAKMLMWTRDQDIPLCDAINFLWVWIQLYCNIIMKVQCMTKWCNDLVPCTEISKVVPNRVIHNMTIKWNQSWLRGFLYKSDLGFYCSPDITLLLNYHYLTRDARDENIIQQIHNIFIRDADWHPAINCMKAIIFVNIITL